MTHTGIQETNPIPTEYHERVTHQITDTVPWTTKGLKITRLRLLTDKGYPQWDVSYCHGTLAGKPVRVTLPFHQLRKGHIITDIIKHAKQDNVYAKRTGILDNIPQLHD